MNEISPFPRSWLLVETGQPLPLETPADCLVIEPAHLAENMRAKKPVFLHIRGGMGDESLAALLQEAASRGVHGLLLADAACGADAQRLDVLLSVAEAVAETVVGQMRIAALPGNFPAGVAGLESFAGKSARLFALGGAGEALQRELLLESTESEPVRQARGRLVLAAAQAGVAALADASPFVSEDAFLSACQRDRADGFRAKLVRDAREAAIANRVFATQGAAGRSIENTSAPPSA